VLLGKKRIHGADYFGIVAGQPMELEDADLPIAIRSRWGIDNQHISGPKLRRTLSALKRARIPLVAGMRLLSGIPLARQLLFRHYKIAGDLSREIGILEEKIRK